MNNFKFNLKDVVKDKVTEFSGVVTARAEYTTGENRYLVEAIDTTGRPIEWWFDEQRLRVV